MGITAQRSIWGIVASGLVIAATTLANKWLVRTWMRMSHRKPPLKPESPATSWGEALAWTAASGLVGAVVGLVALRWGAEVWQKATGHRPPGL